MFGKEGSKILKLPPVRNCFTLAMTNKLVVINGLKVPKTKKMLLYEMKVLVPHYTCLQNPWLGGYRPQFPALPVFRLQLNLLTPPPLRTKFLSTPLVSLLSRRAQSGRWSSFGKRVWFTESHTFNYFFLTRFIYSSYSWYNKWSAISSKTTRSFLGNWHSHFSILSLTPHSYATEFALDC